MSPRLPSRHDAPVTPLEMTEADAVEFARQIATGYDGRAPWRRACVCSHPASMHARGRCQVCSRPCVFQRAEYEVLSIELHPDAVHYLPPDVRVLQVGNRYRAIGTDERGGSVMGVVFHLARDLDAGLGRVVRSGVRKETTLYTSPPNDQEVPE